MAKQGHFRPRTPWGWALAVASVVGPALATGCGSSRPQAPALRDEPVFKSESIGLEFLAPEGWIVKTRAEVPSGPLAKEWRLVRYDRVTGASGATLEVTVAEVPDATDLGTHVAKASFGVKEWRPAGKVEKREINGVPSTRYLVTGQAGAQKLTKEVFAVRRGERVIFFTALYNTGDAKTRDQVRRAVDSARWNG